MFPKPQRRMKSHTIFLPIVIIFMIFCGVFLVRSIPNPVVFPNYPDSFLYLPNATHDDPTTPGEDQKIDNPENFESSSFETNITDETVFPAHEIPSFKKPYVKPVVKQVFTQDVEMSPPTKSRNFRDVPPDEPIIPDNFYQDIEGVNYLEISPGVSVLHNFSAIESTRTFSFANHTVRIVTFDSGFMKEHFVFLPPFDWQLPRGLSDKQIELFWKQPENHWHFDDANMWHTNVVWEIHNGETRISDDSRCGGHNYTHHLNHCEWPRTVQNPRLKGNVFAMGGHYIEIFQHFMDNGIPHMAMGMIATGHDPKTVHVESTACNGVTLQVIDRLGFKSHNSCGSASSVVSAENLIVVPSMRVLHPFFYDWYRERMHFPKKEHDMIVLLPRGGGSGGGNARIIYNVRDIIPPLSKIHGEGKVVVAEKGNLDHLIDYFAKAKAIVGPHGGAFYNHFFADRDIDIVEMIPMMSTGKYPLQNYWDKLIPFAHLAMYSNVQLMRQNFYRYITMDVDINYNIDVDDFMKWSVRVPSLAPPK